MNKKKSFASSLRKISCLLTAALLPGLFLASCATTDRTDDAVEKARAFALERAKDLSEYQRNVIRYSLPKLQEEDIFATQLYSQASALLNSAKPKCRELKQKNKALANAVSELYKKALQHKNVATNVFANADDERDEWW